MFGNHPRVNPLAARKRMLVAESDLNRTQLNQEWAAMAAGVQTLTDRAKSFGSIASAVALLVAGLAAYRRGQRASADPKLSWLQTLLKGAGLVSTIWLAFRRQVHDQKGQ